MADESGDVEMGYVDDDIELDDIDVDEELESLNTTKPNMKGASNSRLPAIPGYKSGHTGSAAPAPGDLYLRPANRHTREVVLAKFLAPDDPDLVGVNRVRLYRHGEGTVKGRNRGLKKHREQLAYYNSYVGKRRTIQKHNVGTQNIPDRNKKSWYLEVTPANTEFAEPPRIDPDSKEDKEKPQYAEGVEAYNSSYEGGSASAKYALLVMNADGKHVDVVPVGDQAWFRFRSIRNTFSSTNMSSLMAMDAEAEANAEKEEEASKKAERLMKKKTGSKLFERLRERSASAAERREGFTGGYNSKAEERLNIATVGIRRKVNAKIELEKSNEKGEAEFEAEFDNDDVDQIDRDDKPKLDASRKARSAQQVKRENAARVRLIKDESMQSMGSNSNSDNDADRGDDSGEGSGSDTEMPAASLSAAIARAKSPSPPRQIPVSVPVVAERRKGEVTKELLPGGDTLIGETHVRAVILALTTERGKAKAPLKELVAHFDELRKKSDAQQKALMKAVKAIGEISKVNEGGKPSYYVALKR